MKPRSSLQRLLLAATLVGGLPAHHLSAAVEPVSASYPGRPKPAGGAGDSSGAAVSADGRYVVFASTARNLLARPLTGLPQNIFVRDRQTRQTQLVSVALDGVSGGDGDSSLPDISADGRLVVFQSRARNLVPESVRGEGDIYVRDLVQGRTELISINRTGSAGGDRDAQDPLMSADGRWVAFASRSTDLAPEGVRWGFYDLYLRDRQSRATRMISRRSTVASGGYGASWALSISADGRFILFGTAATDLVGVTPPPTLLLHDRENNTNTIPILDRDGLVPSVKSPVTARLSADGRYLVFRSTLPNLVPDPGPEQVPALYRRDLQSRETLLIAPSGQGARVDLAQFAISADGRFVAYTSTNQVLVWDAELNRSVVVSLDLNGRPAQGNAGAVRLSPNGRYVVFTSTAPDLVPTPTDGHLQVYLHDRETRLTRLVSAAPDKAAGCSTDCAYPVVAEDSQVVLFESWDGNLAANDLNRATDVFAFNPNAGQVELVSAIGVAGPSALPTAGAWLAPEGLSADGRFALFTSYSAELAPGDRNGVMDVFLRDLVLASNVLVSVNRTATNAGNSGSLLPAMTPDAQGVVFLSRASDLVEGITDTNRVEDVFFRDRTNGLTTLVSVDTTGVMSCGVDAGTRPAVSADGRYVAFVSSAPNLVSEPRPSYPGLFLRDRQTGTTHWLVKETPLSSMPIALLAVTSGPRVFGMSLQNHAVPLYLADLQLPTARLLAEFVFGTPAISADGNRVAYWAPRTGEPGADLCVLDLVANSTDVVVSLGEPAFSSLANREVSLSRDGRFLAFGETSDTLHAGDKNGFADVYVADLQQPGRFILASISVDGTAGNARSEGARLSADGRLVVFRSWASNLAPWDNNGQPDIFVRDLQDGVTRLLSQTGAGDAGDRASFPALFSADGHTVAFGSAATDLFPGDLNLNLDLFAAAVPASAAGDTDDDGLADAWELYHLGTLGWGPLDDPDGDGMSNLAEQSAGTVPWDPASALWLRLEFSDPDPAVPVLVWPGVPGRTYQLEYRDRLAEGSWQQIPMTAAWLGQELHQPDLSSPRGPERFYRVSVMP